MRLSLKTGLFPLANIYVEIFRNIPLLLQILFWYTAVLKPYLDLVRYLNEILRSILEYQTGESQVQNLSSWTDDFSFTTWTALLGILFTIGIHLGEAKAGYNRRAVSLFFNWD